MEEDLDPLPGPPDIGWICATTIELTAAKLMLDKRYKEIDLPKGDTNYYTFGKIGIHTVVIAGLPLGVCGKVMAGNVAENMRRTFPDLRFGLLVGIGAGIPVPQLSSRNVVRVGDIVVSGVTNTSGGVVQYDFGKLNGTKFTLKGALKSPPIFLLNVSQALKSEMPQVKARVRRIMTAAREAYQKEMNQYNVPKDSGDCINFGFPGLDKDLLHAKCTDGTGGCHWSLNPEIRFCGPKVNGTENKPRPLQDPVNGSIGAAEGHPNTLNETQDFNIHYGIIASGDTVIESVEKREEIHKQTGAICIEIAACGVVDNFPCLVIRGICDYADQNRDKIWQPYAALKAAAYAKNMLLRIPGEVQHMAPISSYEST